MLRIRTIRASVLQLHKITLLAVASLGLFSAGIFIFGELAASSDETEHALEHLSRGAPAVLLALAVYRFWRPRMIGLRGFRVLFVMGMLVPGVGQLEHSIVAFGGYHPHIVAHITSTQVAILGLGILLAIANVVKAWRSRVQQRSSQT